MDNPPYNVKDFTKQLMKLLTPSLLIIICFVIGGIVFKLSAPAECKTILSDDSVFVLTGDARRVPFAMRQIQKYPYTDLYIIGAGTPDGFDTARCHLIEQESKSTYQNALAIRDIVSRAGLDRIVVVTTEDHINRAHYLLNQELPETEIVACPAPLTGMAPGKRLERWAVEYVKYIITMFGIKES